MAFFQNNNSVIAVIPSSSKNGNDSLDSAGTSWNDFLNNSIHKERRQAFKEFVFIMFYYRNRELSGVKFPHNVLFQKVLKFFVETTVPITSTSGLPVPATGSQSSLTPIFKETGPGSDVYKPILPTAPPPNPPKPLSLSDLSLIKENTPILRGELWGSNPTDKIKSEINIALASGNTSIGFFQETATLFAHFYLFRQLIILNGYEFNFTRKPSAEALIIRRYQEDDNYQIFAGTDVEKRTDNMMKKVNIPSIDLPYFYKSLINTLKSLGFQVPDTPLSANSSPSNPLPSYVNLKHQEIFLAYFVKLLDPTKPVGARKRNDAKGSLIDMNNAMNEHHGVPTNTKRNAILNIPLSISLSEYANENLFIEDLIITIKSGNYGPDLAGAGSDPQFTGSSSFTNIKKRPFFVNATTLPFTTPTLDEILAIVQKVFNEIRDITQESLEKESRAMMGYFLNKKDIESDNTILASGVGATSVSILGIRNFGLPFFNYEMSNDAVISRTNSKTKDISLEKREAIHIGVYALDLFNGIQAFVSSLKVIIAGGVETYEFSLKPEKGTLSGDLKIYPVSIPQTSNPDFYNLYNSGTGITSYYRKLPRIDKSITGVPELIAEYNEKQRDLIFRRFNDHEIDKVYDFASIYPSFPNKSIKYEVKSSVYNPPATPGGAISSTEELLALISIYEDKYPGIISDDVLYMNDTFQLFGTFAESLALNSSSYERLLDSSNEKLGIQLIFDLIEAADYTVNFIPPSLKGSYVGVIPTSTANIGTRSSKVVPDNRYVPKFASSTPKTEVQGVPNNRKAEFEAIKFSWGRISLTQSPAYPAVPNTIDVQLEIVSFVNPSISHLDANINPASVGLLAEKIKNKIGSDPIPTATNNQVLAMLRSFGLLEGMVEKMKTMSDSRTPSTSTLIKAKLANWLPEKDSVDADTIVCVDENISDSVVLAHDITLNEYYLFKRTL